jgi:hypothetical protein
MRCIVLSLWLGLAAATGFAQTEVDVGERIRLRELLRVSALTEFSQTPQAPLPTLPSLNVHLGFGLDFELREQFVRWIEEWNRKNGKRYASLNIVENLESAHVILAWFPAAENTLAVNTYSPRDVGGVIEKTMVHLEKQIVAFAYILLPVPGTPLHLHALYRSQLEVKQKGTPEDLSAKGERLRAAFFSLLKRHTKKR